MKNLAARLVLTFSLFICLSAEGARTEPAPGLNDTQLSALGTSYAAAINSRDAATLDALFDLQALASKVAATVTSDRQERAEFVRGFMGGAKNMSRQIIEQIHAASGQARFLGMRSFDGLHGPLVRYDLGDQGYNYVLLICEPASNGEARIVDMFIATNGVRMSVTTGAVSQLMLKPQTSILEMLFGPTAMDKKVAATFVELGRLQRQRDYAGAYAKLAELPDAVRNHRVVMNLAVQLASLINEDLYRAELARLAEHFGNDPTAAFALVDHYFYTGNTGAAMASLENMERTFGSDAAINSLKASVMLAARKPDAAIPFATTAVKLEPDNETAHWTLVTVLMSAEQYKQGISALETLEKQFGYAFEPSNFDGVEAYAGFIKSAEFVAWMKQR